MYIHEGEAIFIPPESCLWNLRQAAKRAALQNKNTRRFTVTREEMYYPNMLDRILAAPSALQKEALELEGDITGETDGRIRCAMLWESEREGLLLRREGANLLCAFAPVVTRDMALREREIERALDALARRASDTPVYLQSGVKAGKRNLGDILRYLRECMNFTATR